MNNEALISTPRFGESDAEAEYLLHSQTQRIGFCYGQFAKIRMIKS